MKAYRTTSTEVLRTSILKQTSVLLACEQSASDTNEPAHDP